MLKAARLRDADLLEAEVRLTARTELTRALAAARGPLAAADDSASCRVLPDAVNAGLPVGRIGQ